MSALRPVCRAGPSGLGGGRDRHPQRFEGLDGPLLDRRRLCATASATLPLLNAASASAQPFVASATAAFAVSSFSLLTVAGSFLACERMSTRDFAAATIWGRLALSCSQTFVISAFFVVAAAATSLARLAIAGASARTAL